MATFYQRLVGLDVPEDIERIPADALASSMVDYEHGICTEADIRTVFGLDDQDWSDLMSLFATGVGRNKTKLLTHLQYLVAEIEWCRRYRDRTDGTEARWIALDLDTWDKFLARVQARIDTNTYKV